MQKRHEFVDRIMYLIREKLENNLPKNSSFKHFLGQSKKLIKIVLNKSYLGKEE